MYATSDSRGNDQPPPRPGDFAADVTTAWAKFDSGVGKRFVAKACGYTEAAELVADWTEEQIRDLQRVEHDLRKSTPILLDLWANRMGIVAGVDCHESSPSPIVRT